jgi:hypothetical protein
LNKKLMIGQSCRYRPKAAKANDANEADEADKADEADDTNEADEADDTNILYLKPRLPPLCLRLG